MVHTVAAVPTPVSNDNIVALYGERLIPTAGTEQLVSPNMASVAFPPNEGSLITITSTDPLDVGEVRLIGLDENFAAIDELIDIGNTSTIKFTRINDLVYRGVTPTVGIVEARDSVSTTLYRTISPDAQLSLDAIYSVPARTHAQVIQLYSAITKDANQQSTATVSLYYRFLQDGVNLPFRRPFKFATGTQGSSAADHHNLLPFQSEGVMDFYVAATVSDIDVEVVCKVAILIDKAVG